eukprot:COSAG01_NODE_6546_length_3613_cov_16.807057_4_plen_60_part_00
MEAEGLLLTLRLLLLLLLLCLPLTPRGKVSPARGGSFVELFQAAVCDTRDRCSPVLPTL